MSINWILHDKDNNVKKLFREKTQQYSEEFWDSNEQILLVENSMLFIPYISIVCWTIQNYKLQSTSAGKS